MADDFLTMAVGERRVAVALDHVIEVIRAVAVSPLPAAPAAVEGVIDVRGRVVPVYDARRRFGPAGRSLSPDDRFVLVHAGPRTAALHVDDIEGLVRIPPAAVTPLSTVVDNAQHLAGIATRPDGLIFLHDPAAFLAAAEEERLAAALTAGTDDQGPEGTP